MAQNETIINKLVGRTADGEYYWLDKVFDDTLHGNPFRGAVGTVFRPIPKREEEERTDSSDPDTLDWFRELWQGAVEAGNTEMGLAEWAEHVLSVDGRDAVFDLSYYNEGVEVANKYNEELKASNEGVSEDDLAEISECIGGDRCFSREMEFEEIYDQEALELALSHEES